jgi:hypothetical protein
VTFRGLRAVGCLEVREEGEQMRPELLARLLVYGRGAVAPGP